MMRASLASLLVTSLALATTTPAVAGGKKRPVKKAAPKKDAPAEPAAPAPDSPPAPGPEGGALGDPAAASAPPPPPSVAAPQTPAPQTPAPPTGPVVAPKPPTKEAKAQAKALQKEATQLYNVQKYAEAADKYQQAYLLDPNPAYLYASAQSQRLGGDCTKALQSYQAYMRANPPENERAKATANIERCEQEIREREAAVNADQIKTPYEVPAPPPPPPEEVLPPPPPPPPPPPQKSYLVGHAMLGLGLITVGGGSYLFYAGRKSVADHNATANYDDYLAGRDDADSAHQQQKIGLLVIGGGAALMAGALVYYMVHSRSDEESPPVQAAVSAQSATITFTGSF